MTDYNIKFIKSIKDLNSLKDILNTTSAIALDTEFIRKTTYFAQLSLLQICPKNNLVFILDYIKYPTLLKDTLNIIYASKAIKVFHSAKNDLEIFYNLISKLPTNIFDVQIAYMAIAPVKNISYAALIKNLLNIHLDKTETLSDWKQRPISNKQLEYAILDVTLLFKVYFKLQEILKKQNRLCYIADKLTLLSNPNTYTFNLENAIEQYIKKISIFNNYALLASLLYWRDLTAKKYNLPRQKILSDLHIKDVVKSPNNFNKFYFNNKFMNEEIWSNINKLANTKFIKFNTSVYSKRNFQKTHNLLNLCLELLEFISNKEQIHKELICSKKDLNNFLHQYNLHNNLINLKKVKDLDHFFYDWKYKLFTQKLELFLSGKLNLNIVNNQINFI